MNKRILSLLLCLALVFTTLLSAAASAEDDPVEPIVEEPAEPIVEEPAQPIVEEPIATEIIVEPSPIVSTAPTTEKTTQDEPLTPEDKSEHTDPVNPTDITEEKDTSEETKQAEKTASLYEQLMACTKLEDAQELIDALTDEERTAFLDGLSNEESAALEFHIASLQPAAEPFEPISVINAPGIAPFLPAVNGTAATKSLRASKSVSAVRGIVTSLSENVEGLVVSKTADYSGGSCEITLEAFVTGAVTSTTVTTDVPADIVLVLDVSGSMDYVLEKVGEGIGDISELNTTWGANEGAYKLIIESYSYDMRFENGEWQYYSINYHNWRSVSLIAEYVQDIWMTKMGALKRAVSAFINNVQQKSYGADGVVGGTDDVDHKISIVKYSSDSSIVASLTSVSTGAGTLISSLYALNAGGATAADYGMQNAATILGGIPTSRNSSQVVVMFTDGEPNHENGFDTTVADAAISASKGIKANGATVYTVGIANGCDASVPMASSASNMNKYMHYVSSNFKNAQSMADGGTATYPANGSFYLAASNSAALNTLFQQISENIQTGSASITLGSTAVIKDVVTQYFKLPADTSQVSVKSHDCLTYDDTTGYATWEGTGTALSDAVSFDGNTIKITGFDYYHNFVAENGRTEGDATQTGTFHGRKLVITFNVEPKGGFWGGNDVPTNDPTSGVYENSASVSALKAFDVPTVNVPITVPSFLGNTVDVYYSTTAPSESELYTAIPLPTWEDDFVNAPAYSLEKPLSTTADDSYTVTATVTPKTGSGSGTNSTTANIRVFKPTVTWADSTRYYGDTFQTDFTPLSVVWKHGEDAAPSGMGAAPALSFEFSNGGISTMPNRDVYASVTTKMGDNNITSVTTYEHSACSVSGCSFNSANGQFIVHPLTCSLSIAKTAVGADSNQYFILSVTKPNGSTMTVAVKANGSQKIVGLPIGTYTVNEAEDWSWRFNDGSNTETLGSVNPNGSITLTNTMTNNQWLTGAAAAVNRWIEGAVRRGGDAA